MPFLDILISGNPDGSLSHKVYSKPIHTYLYLSNWSHHPAQKRSVLTTLMNRALEIDDSDSVEEELAFLKRVLLQNGYQSQEIDGIIRQQWTGVKIHELEEEEIQGVAIIPFCSFVTSGVGRLLKRQNIKIVSHPHKKLRIAKTGQGSFVAQCSL